MKSILITGSNRGIGLEIVKQLASHQTPPEIIIATCRNPTEAKELKKLAEKHKSIHILKLDTTDYDSHRAFVQSVQEIVMDKGLNLLINNAGIAGEKQAQLSSFKPEQFAEMYNTNTIAPIFLTQALRPLLKVAASRNSNQPLGASRAAVVNITSGLGSISQNTFGRYYGYRESKAALNTATRSISYELIKDGILAVGIHPGWVKTDMGGSNADLTVEFSSSNIINTILSLQEKHSGAFLQYDGKILPW